VTIDSLWKLKAIQASRFPRKGLQSHPFLDYPGFDVASSHQTECTETVERKVAWQYCCGADRKGAASGEQSKVFNP